MPDSWDYWRRKWQPTPVLLPGDSHGRRSLVGYGSWGRKESDMTEQLHFHFHALEKEMATHSNVLAWRIPGTGEPGGLPSVGSCGVGRDWSNLAAAAWDYSGWQMRWCSGALEAWWTMLDAMASVTGSQLPPLKITVPFSPASRTQDSHLMLP